MTETDKFTLENKLLENTSNRNTEPDKVIANNTQLQEYASAVIIKINNIAVKHNANVVMREPHKIAFKTNFRRMPVKGALDQTRSQNKTNFRRMPAK